MHISNRKVHHNYELFDKFEAGIALSGPEVKSVREGKMSLDEAFVRIKSGEVFLVNAHIHPYQFAVGTNVDSRRERKLLLHKKEILVLGNKVKQRNLTIVPVSCYIRGRKVKLEIALAKNKREYEKREAAKKKDVQRQIEQELTS